MLLAVALATLLTTSAAPEQSLQPSPPAQPATQKTTDASDPNKPGTAVMRGRVLGADTGEPLRKAQLRLMSIDASGGSLRENRQATADADGRYEFKDLRAGRYSLTASKGGYVLLSFGQTQPRDPSKPIDLLDAQLLERVDFTLPRGGVITGRVVDEYGEPMSNVQVMAQFVQAGGRSSPGGRASSTNDLGEFRVYGLPPGQYYVQGTFRNVQPVNTAPGAIVNRDGYAPTFFPGVPDTTGASRITIRAGQTVSDVAFALVPVKTTRVSGTAMDSHGKAMQGMVMVVVQDDKDSFSSRSGAPLRPDGSFTIPHVTPGSYTLIAQGLGADREAATAKITVAGEDISDLQLVALPWSTATGRIVIDPAAAQAVAGASLSVATYPVESMMFFMQAPPVKVGDDMTFTLKARAGLMRVVLLGQPQGFDVRAVRAGSIDVTDTGVEFKPGEDLKNLEIELTNQVTTVSGLVSDSRGDAAKDYTVIVFSQDQSRWKPGSRYTKQAQPDQNGRFKVMALPPGDYYAIALDRIEGAWNTPDALDALRPGAKMFSLNEGETKTLDLKLARTP